MSSSPAAAASSNSRPKRTRPNHLVAQPAVIPPDPPPTAEPASRGPLLPPARSLNKKLAQQSRTPPPVEAEIIAALAALANDTHVARPVLALTQPTLLGEGWQPRFNDELQLVWEAITEHYGKSSGPISKAEMLTRVNSIIDLSGNGSLIDCARVDDVIAQVCGGDLLERQYALSVWARIVEMGIQQTITEELMCAGMPADGVAAALNRYRPQLEAAQALAGGGERQTKYLSYSAQELEAADLQGGYVVDGLLAAGQLCLLGGPKKALKTTLAVSLAVSIASGRKVFGHFAATRCHRVTVCSAESGLRAIRAIARRAARAIGYAGLAAVPNIRFVGAVPKLNNAIDWAEFVSEVVDQHSPEVLIIDPAYKCFNGVNAENIFAMGALLDVLDQFCQSRGITPILAHHLKTTREDRYGFADLDDLTYAGFAEQAAQWLLLTRREKYQAGSGSHRLWLQVGGRAGHDSGWALDIEEGDPEVPAARRLEIKLARAGESIEGDRRQRANEQEMRKAAEVEARDRKHDELVAGMLATAGVVNKETIKGVTHLSGTQVAGALSRLVQMGRVVGQQVSASRSTYSLSPAAK